MKPLDHDTLRALGISDALLSLSGQDQAPDDRVASGLSSAPPAAFSAEETLRWFADSTPIHAFSSSARAMGAEELVVSRSDRVPGLFQIAAEALPVEALGAARRDGDLWIVDSRAEEAALRVQGSRGECLLRFEGAVMQWFNIVRSPSETLSAEQTPSPDALLGGFDAPSWLLDPLHRTHDVFSACAAVGTLGRLWSPRGTSVAPSAALARAMADDDPLARSLRWFRALPRPAQIALARRARFEADRLRARLDALTERSAHDLSQAREEARAWLEARDDLASAALLLRSADLAPEVTPALDALDRDAQMRASMWRLLASVRSARLDAVAWQFPELWWASSARE